MIETHVHSTTIGGHRVAVRITEHPDRGTVEIYGVRKEPPTPAEHEAFRAWLWPILLHYHDNLTPALVSNPETGLGGVVQGTWDDCVCLTTVPRDRRKP